MKFVELDWIPHQFLKFKEFYWNEDLGKFFPSEDKDYILINMNMVKFIRILDEEQLVEVNGLVGRFIDGI